MARFPTKKKLSRNGRRSYESIIRLCLVPYLATLRVDMLRIRHVADMFDAIAEHNDEIVAGRASKDPARRESVKWQRPIGSTSMQRIREVLRKALNAASREELIVMNPAKWVEGPPAVRPKPLVRTPEQAGQFLDHVVHHRLHLLFLLVAHRGSRRGEACEARWPDTNLNAEHMYARNRIVQYGWETGMSRRRPHRRGLGRPGR